MSHEKTAGEIPELIEIASILTSFGIKGELKARILTDFPERFKTTSEVYLVSPQGEREKRELRGARFHKGYVLLTLSGISNPEEAALRRGWTVNITAGELAPLEEGEYWQFQIKGLSVYDQHNNCMGTIREIYTYPDCDHYLVRGSGGQECVIPAVARFIRKIDLKAKRMDVELPENM